MSEPFVKPMRVVILGAGLEAVAAAAVLANGTQHTGVEISLVETPQTMDLDGCAALSPSVHIFNQLLGIDEADLVRSTSASFTLAQCYSRPSRQPYFFPFGEHGFKLRDMQFFDYAVHLHNQGDSARYDQYSLASVAASLGRFRHPSQDKKSLFSTLVYGLNISPSAYRDYLRTYALARGVKFIAAECDGFRLDGDSGDIAALELLVTGAGDSRCAGQRLNLECDLLIDCTGAQAVAIDQQLDVKWRLAPALSMVDRRLDVTLPHLSTAPANECYFLAAGIARAASLNDRLCVSYWYDSSCTNPVAAASELLNRYNAADSLHDVADPLPFKPGRRDFFWYKNCVAIGASAGDLGALYIDPLHLVQSASLRLLTLFPSGREFSQLAAEYNRLTHLEYDHIEDFHALHFCLPEMPASDFWQRDHLALVSETLRYRITCFEQTGRMPFFEGDTLAESAWLSFMLGLCGWPSNYNRLIIQNDTQWIKDQLAKMRQIMHQAALSMPAHDAYLKHYLANYVAS